MDLLSFDRFMDTPFQFDKFVTGRYFVGRRRDCQAIAEAIGEGESLAIWGPHEAGKMSAVRQALYQMKVAGKQCQVCEVDLTPVRNIDAFFRIFEDSVLRAGSKTPEGRSELASKYLSSDGGQDEFSADDNRWQTSVLSLPYRIAEFLSMPLVVILKEFQNVDFDGAEKCCRLLERVIDASRGNAMPPCSFIFMGSEVNAMEYIFLRKKYFRDVTRAVRLSPISDSDITEHVLRGFSAGGKVADRELVQNVCNMLHNEIGYINQFFFICDSLSKGYISELTVKDALSCMLAVHVPSYQRIMRDLTGYQVRLLKAILDGKTKFSTSDVIDSYGLNSSANVKRLKDALMKKEIVCFNDKDEPELQDPLFDYWLRNFYFA